MTVNGRCVIALPVSAQHRTLGQARAHLLASGRRRALAAEDGHRRAGYFGARSHVPLKVPPEPCRRKR